MLMFLVSCGDTERVEILVKEPNLDQRIEDALDEYLADADLSCTVKHYDEGAMIVCPDGSSQFIEDGRAGEKGEKGDKGDLGEAGLFLTWLDPCGEENRFDELLYLDRHGNWHAWFKDVGHTILDKDVNYQTTDTHNICRFRVNAAGGVEHTVRAEAKRERPSGAFIQYENYASETVVIPATMKIPQSGLRPQGLWVELLVGDLSFCYQARGHGTQSNNWARTLDLKHTTPNMVGDCSANAVNPILVSAGTKIMTNNVLVMTVLNSGKNGSGQHVTTKVRVDLDLIN